MKKFPTFYLIVLITSINLCVAMEKSDSESDEEIFRPHSKKTPSQYHSIRNTISFCGLSIDKDELKVVKFLLSYLSFFQKHIRYGGNKHQRANYNSAQKYINIFFKKQFDATLSDDEEFVKSNETITPKWLSKEEKKISDSDSEFKTEDKCPLPSGSLSDNDSSNQSPPTSQTLKKKIYHENHTESLELLERYF